MVKEVMMWDRVVDGQKLVVEDDQLSCASHRSSNAQAELSHCGSSRMFEVYGTGRIDGTDRAELMGIYHQSALPVCEDF